MILVAESCLDATQATDTASLRYDDQLVTPAGTALLLRPSQDAVIIRASDRQAVL